MRGRKTIRGRYVGGSGHRTGDPASSFQPKNVAPLENGSTRQVRAISDRASPWCLQFPRQYATALRTARGLVSGRAWNRSPMTRPVRRIPRSLIALLIWRAAEIEKPRTPPESAALLSASTMRWIWSAWMLMWTMRKSSRFAVTIVASRRAR